jgi:hypothetical protein
LGGGKEIINIFHNLAKKEKKLFLKLDSLAQERKRRVFFFKTYIEQVGSLSECILP